MGLYTELMKRAQNEYGFSPRMALEFAMEQRYHGADFTTASQRAVEASERMYRATAQDIMEDLKAERDENPDKFSGYSIGKLASIMAVLECNLDTAKELNRRESTCNDLDWSEATWEEIYSCMSAHLENYWYDTFSETDRVTETEE